MVGGGHKGIKNPFWQISSKFRDTWRELRYQLKKKTLEIQRNDVDKQLQTAYVVCKDNMTIGFRFWCRVDQQIKQGIKGPGLEEWRISTGVHTSSEPEHDPSIHFAYGASVTSRRHTSTVWNVFVRKEQREVSWNSRKDQTVLNGSVFGCYF